MVLSATSKTGVQMPLPLHLEMLYYRHGPAQAAARAPCTGSPGHPPCNRGTARLNTRTKEMRLTPGTGRLGIEAENAAEERYLETVLADFKHWGLCMERMSTLLTGLWIQTVISQRTEPAGPSVEFDAAKAMSR